VTHAAEEPTAVVPATRAEMQVAPQVSAAELGQRLEQIKLAMDDAMQRDVDYGVVPGTNKPALFKPGAEKLSVLFQLDIQPRSTKTFGPGEHLTVETSATVFHAPTGARMGYGEGLCTTRERKYRWRTGKRKCPECEQEFIIKGKAEYGGGWLCFAKIGGCGAKFEDTDPAIIGQDIGDVENPDLPDLWNTVIKMAEKRARVNAVLAVTGASALFTQDLEEGSEAVAESASAATMPLADEAQKQELREALAWLLPADAARAVWGDVKRAYEGEMAAPIVWAVVQAVNSRRVLEDEDFAATVVAAEAEAKPDAEAAAQDEAAEAPDEKPAEAKGKKKAAAKK
jgi:hypothetical protein